MDVRTISDNFRDIIGEHGRVVAAVFTTYNFEPDFFEREVIPLMLDQSLAYSMDTRIKRIQVREALGQAGLPIEVFYDRNIFRRQGTESPAMEYLHHGIQGERSALHAKLIFLLIEDEEEGRQSLMFGAGSANLTNAGWWTNVECQHWEHVRSGEANRRFLNQLRDDVAWLKARRMADPDETKSALSLVDQYLTACRSANGAGIVHYYGLSSLGLGRKNRPAFMKFLLDAQESYYKRWSLEIISPYFADQPDFVAHEFFFNDLGVENIRMFLPESDQGEALCDKAYFDRIKGTENIEWCTWAPGQLKKFGGGRYTHAKIYHFYNGVQSWVFVGSVNFTRRAIYDNQEAGFFTKLPSRVTLLTPIKGSPDKWCSEKDQIKPGYDHESDSTTLDITLIYDWKRKQLQAAIHGHQPIDASILSPEKEEIGVVQLTEALAIVECDVAKIEKLLQDSGFILLRTRMSSEIDFSEQSVLVQQIHWTHKPLDIPRLSPQEIMQIYAGLSEIRRNQIIELLKEREFREKGLSGESAGGGKYLEQGQQFFAEYAELFHAFRNLRDRMHEDLEKKRENQLDYYLSGSGMDSLPTLLGGLLSDDNILDVVTKYLTLLCLIQIYREPQFCNRPQVNNKLAECEKQVRNFEDSGDLKLIDSDRARSRKFFKWYKEQFFREYRSPVEVE